MADQDRERWVRVVATFEESGQSQREFAKEQELSLSNLRYWIYRLRRCTEHLDFTSTPARK